MFTPFKKLYISLEQLTSPDVLYSLFNKLQNNIEASFMPLNKTQNDSTVLSNVELAVGTNTINHRLGRKLLGWNIIRQRGAAAIYDSQDSNTESHLTLKLVSDQAVTVDILVF